MNERLEHKSLTKQERFVLSVLSNGLTSEELQVRIDRERKNPDSGIFPEFFGHSMYYSLLEGLLSRGLIKKDALVTTDLGKKELEDDKRKRTMFRPPPAIRPDVRPAPRPAEPIKREPSKPAPLVRYSVSVPPVETKKPDIPVQTPKKKEVRLRSFKELENIRIEELKK